MEEEEEEGDRERRMKRGEGGRGTKGRDRDRSKPKKNIVIRIGIVLGMYIGKDQGFFYWKGRQHRKNKGICVKKKNVYFFVKWKYVMNKSFELHINYKKKRYMYIIVILMYTKFLSDKKNTEKERKEK